MPNIYDEEYRDDTPPYIPPIPPPPPPPGPTFPPGPGGKAGGQQGNQGNQQGNQGGQQGNQYYTPPNQQNTGGYYEQYGQQDVLGTDLQSALGDEYNVEALQAEYGNIFGEYDPTRETFAQQGLAFGQEAAGIGYGRQKGQYERQAELLGSQLGEEGYLAQAMGRQMGQLGLSREAAQSSAAFQTGELGRQRAGTQRGISQTYTGGRQGLMAMREQAGQAAGRGGFAGSGAAQTQSERARQAYMGQLGGGVANLRDRLTGIGAREQQVQSDLSRQMRGFGIQEQGIQAGYGEATQRAQSQLSGIQSEIGEGGFLSQAYQNQLGQLGLGFQEDVYGLRDKYGEKQRDRLMDLIASGADLSRFMGSGDPTKPGGTDVDIDVDPDPNDPDPLGEDDDWREGGTGTDYDKWLASQGQTTDPAAQYGRGWETNPDYVPGTEKDIRDMNINKGPG